MQRPAILALFDRQMRIEAPLPGKGFKREGDSMIVRLLGPTRAAYDNCVIYSKLNEATADAAIRQEMILFGTQRRAFEWKIFSHDSPADLDDRLLRCGFTAEGKETLLVRPLSDEDTALRSAPWMHIRRIQRLEEIADVLIVQDEVWDENHGWLGDALARELAETADDLEILVADLQDVGPVATSWMRRHPGTSFASIWGAATLAPFRGRGIYKALVNRHLATARRRGAEFMTVDANDNSRPILERIGFEPLVQVQGFVWQPPE